MKVIRWVKKNWYYLLIIPAIAIAIMYLLKVAAAMISGSDEIAGTPDTTDIDRDIQDIDKDVDDKFKEKEDEIKKDHNKDLEELSNGSKKPSDIFNEEIFGDEDE